MSAQFRTEACVMLARQYAAQGLWHDDGSGRRNTVITEEDRTFGGQKDYDRTDLVHGRVDHVKNVCGEVRTFFRNKHSFFYDRPPY